MNSVTDFDDPSLFLPFLLLFVLVRILFMFSLCWPCVACRTEESGLPADSVGHVNAHATSTPLGDAAEGRAIERVFGPR